MMVVSTCSFADDAAAAAPTALEHGAARAGEPPDPGVAPRRVRRDPASFAGGLVAAITGGVAIQVGAGLMLSQADMPATPGFGNEGNDDVVLAGGIVMLAGAALVALGLPLAIAGGTRVPAPAVARSPVSFAF